jgi:hypothetical protein
MLAGKDMQTGLKLDESMRAVAMAIGVAIATSVISMFLPVSLFEAVTGSTGISELVPASAAPLGDTARALIAFGLGVVAFALSAALFLRNSAPAKPIRPSAPETAAVEDYEAEPSFFESVKVRIADFVASRRSDNVVTELSDLPKLRPGDAHPDAPPRRPISAHRDFADIAGGPVGQKPVENAAPATTVLVRAEAVAEMVDQLEAAVTVREQQLAKLEAIATAEAAKQQEAAAEIETVRAEIMEPVASPLSRPMILEAVPNAPIQEGVGEGMDAALRAALETLHRMNARPH